MSNAYTFVMPICGARITIENVDNIRVNTIETLILSNDQTIADIAKEYERKMAKFIDIIDSISQKHDTLR